MANDRSLAAFISCVLDHDELLYLGVDDAECTRVPRRCIRDRLNPCEHFDEHQFLARYRFTKATVRSLLETLPLESSVSNRGLPLPPMLQLLVALRFYGAGTFQVVAGDLVNVSQPTVCRVVERISRLLASTIFKELVKFPQTAMDFDAVMRDFYEIGKFPGVTGCIDCTHVRIKGPGGSEGEVFRNRKGYFSINVQVSPVLCIGTMLERNGALGGIKHTRENNAQKYLVASYNTTESGTATENLAVKLFMILP